MNTSPQASIDVFKNLDALFGHETRGLSRINAVTTPLGRTAAAVFAEDTFEWKGPFTLMAANVKRLKKVDMLSVLTLETGADGTLGIGKIPVIKRALVNLLGIHSPEGLLPDSPVSEERELVLQSMRKALWQLAESGSAYDALSHEGRARDSLCAIARGITDRESALFINQLVTTEPNRY